ncbi:protein transport protein S31 [Coemansia guatemalensis]|uniref:Protein transport protein SEC31 n=1 Tax=Coemansia guatemalensis TaxID=2761395 RepID=A0A9W8LSZ1_9FUNG|nr:protein transport protein S31 [Coemansia guatemalensis]
MGYQYIERTAVPAWGPQQSETLVATGTVAGAMDATFSNTSELEIFKLPTEDGEGPLSAVGKVEATGRFQRLAWSRTQDAEGMGVIAGGLENGDVSFWDASKIIKGSDAAETATLHTSSAHTGAVCGLEFNPQQQSLVATGATNGEVFVWDIVSEFKSHAAGTRSQRIDSVTDLAWNNQVQHILATASNTGAVVVWDLRQHREVMALNSPGTLGAGSVGRPGASAVVWNPASATQLVSASADDNSPAIQFWDLRNANAPARTLNGHQRGVLSLSWCRKDAGLLLSSAKDCRSICWNPATAEIVGELPSAANWVYDVQWNQANPNLLSAASFDGRVGLYELCRKPAAQEEAAAAAPADPFAAQPAAASLALARPPQWLARPCGARFAHGGKLVHFGSQGGAGHPAPVSITALVSEPELAEQARQLESLLQNDRAADLCRQRLEQCAGSDQERSWQVLNILFEPDARDKLIRFLGFDREAVRQRIEELLASRQSSEASVEADVVPDAPQSPEEQPETVEGAGSVAEDNQDAPADDLFSGTASADAEAEEFFSKSPVAAPESTAATIGTTEAADSAAPSVTADVRALQVAFSGEFHLYDKAKDVAAEDSDGLVTRAVLLGDIESAVSLCIEQQRFADALILATCGSAELATRAQQAYFAKRAEQASYVRLLHGIVTGDLQDIVNNADISEWDECLALLCTYAQGDQFSTLCEALGRRLEAAQQLSNAVICYLASGNLDKVAAIWIVDERATLDCAKRVQSLHNLVEKVSVFRKAVQFIDPAAADVAAEEHPVFPLAPLYDVYIEYAQFLLSQGLVDVAACYLERVPSSYRRFLPTGEDMLATLRNRLDPNADTPWTPAPVSADGAQQQQQVPQQQQRQVPQQQQQVPQQQQQQYGGVYGGYPTTNMPAAQQYSSRSSSIYPTASVPSASYPAASSGYPAAASAPYAGMAQGYPAQNSMFPPPPQPLNPASIPTGRTPPPRRDEGAWNDPPPMVKPPPKRSAQNQGSAKPAAIVSPFPQGRDTPPPASVAPFSAARSPLHQQQQQPPPPRAGFVPSSKPMPPPPPPPAAAAAGMAFPNAQHAPPQPQAQPFQTNQPPQFSQQQPPFQPQQPGFIPPSAGPAPTMAPQSTRGHVVSATGGSGAAAQPRTATPVSAKKALSPEQTSKYPPGDRSHLPAEWKPLVASLSGHLEQARKFAAPAQKRMVDDAGRRLDALFDLMNCDSVQMKDKLVPVFGQLVSALDSRQYPLALQSQAELMSINSEITTNLVGVKHLINVLKTLPM